MIVDDGRARSGTLPPCRRVPSTRRSWAGRHGEPRRHRVHLHVDRPDLPAEPGRAGGLQRRAATTATSRSTLEQAQHRKHEYIAEQIGIGPGRRLLDLGCGWGALLNFARGAARGRRRRAVLRRRSPRAAATASTCTSRTRATVDRDTYGPFDAVASLGAWEHFCSPEDYRAGRQEEIYRSLFANAAERARGRWPLLPADDGVRAQHDPARRGLRARPARLRRVHPVPARLPVPGLVAADRRATSWSAAPSRTSGSSRARAGGSTTSRRSRSGTGGSARRACARTCSSCALLPHWLRSPDVPLRLHLGREREQGLLRARAARPLPDGVREDLSRVGVHAPLRGPEHVPVPGSAHVPTPPTAPQRLTRGSLNGEGGSMPARRCRRSSRRRRSR